MVIIVLRGRGGGGDKMLKEKICIERSCSDIQSETEYSVRMLERKTWQNSQLQKSSLNENVELTLL